MNLGVMVKMIRKNKQGGGVGLYIHTLHSLRYKVIETMSGGIVDVVEYIFVEICMRKQLLLSAVYAEVQHPTLKPLKTAWNQCLQTLTKKLLIWLLAIHCLESRLRS